MNDDILRAIEQVAHIAEQDQRAADIETYIRDAVSKTSLDVQVVLFQCIDHLAVNFGMKWADWLLTTLGGLVLACLPC